MGGTSALLVVSDGRAAVAPDNDPSVTVDATIVTEPATLRAIAAGRLGIAEAFTQGQLHAEGDPQALAALGHALSALELQV